MKLVRTLAATAAVSLMSLAANAGATTINFDTDAAGNAIASNTSITEQYAAWGVHFLGLENGNAINVNAAPDADAHPVPSNPNAMSNCADASFTCPGNRADIVRVTFDNPINAVSVMVDSLGSQSITFDMYDSLGALLSSASIGATGGFAMLALNTSGVSRIDVLQPTDGWAYNFDDLTFDAADVPEPAMLGLMGLGVLGLAARRRRKA